MSNSEQMSELEKRTNAARSAYEKASRLRRQLESGHTPAELGFSNMIPQEAVLSEWLTSYREAGGVDTIFFEDAVASLRRLRTGSRIKALYEAMQRDNAGLPLEGIDWLASLWPTSGHPVSQQE